MKKTLARGPLSRTLTLGGGRSCPVKFLNEIGRYIQKFYILYLIHMLQCGKFDQCYFCIPALHYFKATKYKQN